MELLKKKNYNWMCALMKDNSLQNCSNMGPLECLD